MHFVAGPPSRPRILPVEEILVVGGRVRLTCLLARPGNPPASLTWQSGNTVLPGETSNSGTLSTTRQSDLILSCFSCGVVVETTIIVILSALHDVRLITACY